MWASYFYSYHRPYFRQDPSPGGDYLAVLAGVFLLAAFFWGGVRLARRWGNSTVLAALRLLFLLSLVIVTGVIGRGLQPTRGPLATEPSLWSWTEGVFALGAGLAALYVCARWNRKLAHAAAQLVLYLSPFLLVTGAQALWLAASSGAEAPARQAAARLPRAASSPRVVWLVFDGLDQRLAFDERPAGLALPEFDRLRSESLAAARALPTSTATLVSLPSLLTGRTVTYCDPKGTDELMIYTEGSPAAVRWSEQPTLFSRARELGVNSGLAGWFHPYCRLFGDQLVTCASWPFRFTGEPRSLAVRVRDAAAMLVWSFPFADQFFFVDPLGLDLFPTRDFREAHRRKQEGILERARAMAADPTLGLVFVHLPMPHGPGIYDRRSREFRPPSDSEEWYLDNLALADRSLGEVRRALTESGLAEQSTIVVTSDHSWGASGSFDGRRDPRVPLLIRLPGERQGRRYEARVHTVVLQELVLALLRGELKSLDQVVRWLDEHPAPRSGQPQTLE